MNAMIWTRDIDLQSGFRALCGEVAMHLGIRSTGLALSFVVVLAGAAWAQAPVGKFASVEGTAELRRGDAGPQRPGVGSPVLASDELEVGDTGRVRILMTDDTLLDLGAASELIVEGAADASAAGQRNAVKLDKGMMRAQRDRSASSFEIETPSALVRTQDGDVIVRYDAEDRSSDVFCLDGRVQVQGTLGVIGKGVELTPGRSTRVQSGGFPVPARDVDAAQVATYERQLEIVGTGSDDHLDSGNPLTTGHLMAATDRPQLPQGVQAAAGESYLETLLPGETLIEQLSPDLRTNTQPIPEYKLAPPGEQPPPLNDN